MERTISGMMGKGSENHNKRRFHAKHIDSTRTKYNVEFCQENIKDVYHKLFDDALERYNAKQKRNDRKIDDYYKKIERGKQEKPFHEVILQIGNKDDMNARSENGQLAKEILVDFMQDFQRRNPHLYVFSAYLHMDEEKPHVHIDFVPFICGSKRGLDTRVSLKGALAAQGFHGGSRGESEWNQWIESEKQELSKVMGRYGIQWKHLGTHNKHLSVLNYKKQEREKEVAKLDQALLDGKAELSEIVSQQILAEKETERMKNEGDAIRQEVSELSAKNVLLRQETDGLIESRKKLLSDNGELEQQQRKLQKEINKMAQSKETMERNVHIYDEDAKWQLPETGMLMTAKSYREKNAAPLVIKLKDTVKSLTIRCVRLTEENKKLKEKTTKQTKDVEFYKVRIHQQSSKLEQLQEKADDFERVKRYAG
ncbi:MAG: plasmid recombination protein, partial [Muribaculaceae bacterium]|nr:plasmid recombination protein [Muribaculaceae bacterium]